MALFNSSEFVLTIQLEENLLNESNVPFAHATDCSLAFSNNLYEATLGKSDGWTQYVSGKKETAVNFSGLYDWESIAGFQHGIEDLGDFLIDQTRIYFNIGHLVDGNYQGFEHGEGYISEITLQGGANDIATYSGVLTMTGPLSEVPMENLEAIQDSDGNDIIDDFGQKIYAKIR